MLIFFITFFTIYGGIHLYAFLKARAAFDLRLNLYAALFMIIAVYGYFEALNIRTEKVIIKTSIEIMHEEKK